MKRKKIIGSLLKVLYKVTHSRKYYHNRNIWHLFKVSRGHNGGISKVSFKGREIRINNHLPMLTKDSELVIVASGPSVKKIDNIFFCNKKYDFFGVNGAVSIGDINFSYYCIMDPAFIRARIDLVKKVVSKKDLILFCNFISLHEIVEMIADDDIKCSFKIIESVVHGTGRYFLGGSEKIALNDREQSFHWVNGFAFSFNMNDFIFDYGTVTYPALQVACALGYKTIYIAGLDMNNFNEPRFYESSNEKQPVYLGKDFHDITGGFYAAADYCRMNNIKVINLSIDSAIDSFKKMNFYDV